jgi:hypothetical protein
MEKSQRFKGMYLSSEQKSIPRETLLADDKQNCGSKRPQTRIRLHGFRSRENSACVLLVSGFRYSLLQAVKFSGGISLKCTSLQPRRPSYPYSLL